MPIDVEKVGDTANRNCPIPLGDDIMIPDLKKRLLSSFDLLDDAEKHQAVELLKQFAERTGAKPLCNAKGKSNSSPWDDIIPLRLEGGASLSEAILAERAESNE